MASSAPHCVATLHYGTLLQYSQAVSTLVHTVTVIRASKKAADTSRSLFETSDFSDLIISTHTHDFKVHKAIICPKSNFLQAVCCKAARVRPYFFGVLLWHICETDRPSRRQIPVAFSSSRMRMYSKPSSAISTNFHLFHQTLELVMGTKTLHKSSTST